MRWIWIDVFGVKLEKPRPWGLFLTYNHELFSLATPRSMWDPSSPNQRWNPLPLQWKHRFLTTRLTGKPPVIGPNILFQMFCTQVPEWMGLSFSLPICLVQSQTQWAGRIPHSSTFWNILSKAGINWSLESEWDSTHKAAWAPDWERGGLGPSLLVYCYLPFFLWFNIFF